MCRECWAVKQIVHFLSQPTGNKWWAVSLQAWGKNEFLAKWYPVPDENVPKSGPLFFPKCRIGVECQTRGGYRVHADRCIAHSQRRTRLASLFSFLFCLAPFTCTKSLWLIIALGLHRNSINGIHIINYFLHHLIVIGSSPCPQTPANHCSRKACFLLFPTIDLAADRATDVCPANVLSWN
jgi:hypothetical protein